MATSQMPTPNAPQPIPCPSCHGTGLFDVEQASWNPSRRDYDWRSTTGLCAECGGTGEAACAACGAQPATVEDPVHEDVAYCDDCCPPAAREALVPADVAAEIDAAFAAYERGERPWRRRR